jgi:two-component system sensor histidine kinase/response regulator
MCPLSLIRNLFQKLIKRLLPLLLSLLASIAVLLMWQQLTINEQFHIEQLIQQEANAIESQLSEQLLSRILMLRQMANRWEVSGGTTKKIWEADAATYIENFSGYQAIEWVDPSFKVRWVVPLIGNERSQNLDLSQESRIQIALQVSRDLREIILTHNITLSQGGKGFLAIFPLFVGDRFDGFIMGVFNFQLLFDSILKVPPGYNIAIYNHEDLIYGQPHPSPPSLHTKVVVKTWRADWQVEVFPTPELIAKVKSYLPIVVLIGGLVLVWIFALVVYLAQISYRQNQEFKKANRELQWEIHQRQQAEIEIARLAAIVESSEDAIISKNLDGIITSWNLGAEKLFGYTAEEIVGESINKLISAEYQDEKEQIIQKIYRGEHISHYDTKRLTKDGKLIDVSISISPIKDHTGKVIGASRIARDITERKQAEAALRQSEERWQLAVNGNNDGIWDWNVKTNEVFFSSRWKEMLGYEDHEIENTVDEWINRVHPDDLAWVKQTVQDHFAKQSPFYLTEHRVLCKDGSYKWILDRGQALWDDAGNVIRMAGSHTDITERKQSEFVLQENEVRYRQLINNLNAGFVIHATDTSILLCNQNACELLGLSMDQMLGKTAIDPAWYFVREDGTKMPIEEYPVNRVLCTEVPIKNYLLGIHTGIDPIVWVLVNAYPEWDMNGKLKQVAIIFIDISKRKQAEEEIKQTRNFLRALLDNLPVAIFVKDGHPERFGVFQFWNKTSEQLFGISAAEAIGKTDYDFFPVEQAKYFYTKDEEIFAKGIVENIHEEVVESHSLGKRFLHTVKVPIFDEQNQPHYLLGFSEDITDRKQAEAELKEMSEVMKNAVSGISKIDPEGHYLYVNQAYSDVTGYPPEEMIGMLWEKTVHPDELEKLIAAYWQMVKEGRVEVETRGIRKDGSVFYKQLVMISTYDEQHQFLGHYCFMKDISDRKQAEIALAKELLRSKTFFNTSMDGVVIMDRYGKVIESSPSFAQMIGYSLEEIMNLSVFDWDAKWTKEELQGILEMEEFVPLFETIHRRKDGSVYDVEISYNRVELEGERVNFCICRDITERKRNEAERKQSEKSLRYQKEMFQAIVNNIPVMIALFDEQGQIELINPELEIILGWPLEDWQQKDIFALCYPDPVYRQNVRDFMFSATGKWRDLTTLTATGERLETTWANLPLSDGHFLGIGQDISDRKHKELALLHAMEAAESANLAKSIFLANMSHELRTPLNVILGFTQVMAHDSSLTPNQQEDLQTIRRSGDHLLSLINDVLDLSKIESGHCTIEETGFDLIALLHSLRNMLAERASSKGLDLCFEIAPEVPQFVIADAQKLRQVLLNLLSNAIKFTDRGIIILRVSIESSPGGDGIILRFSVIDTGVGIGAEEIDTIFDAFVQAQAGKRSVSGTGLGLTISRKLLEIIGGEISVSSMIGKGTTFTFTLPVTPINGINLTPEQKDRLVIGLAPGQSHHRILVVDDRAENRLLMVRLLTQLGLEVKEATNGLEAVQIWQQWLPDLTWMDIRMPILDGYEATKQIRALEQGPNSVIIALTAQASQSDRTLALTAGCNDYISKPFREQTLFLKMAQYLGLEYVYEQEENGNQEENTDAFPSYLSSVTSNLTDSLDPKLLATLPEVLLEQLEDAVICGNDGVIAELAAQFPPELTQLGVRLTELGNQYQFEQILSLIHSISAPI